MSDGEPLTAGRADLSPLVSAAQSGDDEAFRSLYRAVQPGLLRYLRTVVGEDADDVASETWLQIARNIRTFRGKEGFRAWAATIARNRALDHLRHQRRRPAVSLPVEQLLELPGIGDTFGSASESISTDAALALIRTLPRDQAEAVLLRVVVGLDAETAGKVLGKRAGAVRTAAYRGLRRLAENLESLNQLAAAAGRHHGSAATGKGLTGAGVTDMRPTTSTGTR